MLAKEKRKRNKEININQTNTRTQTNSQTKKVATSRISMQSNGAQPSHDPVLLAVRTADTPEIGEYPVTSANDNSKRPEEFLSIFVRYS